MSTQGIIFHVDLWILSTGNTAISQELLTKSNMRETIGMNNTLSGIIYIFYFEFIHLKLISCAWNTSTNNNLWSSYRKPQEKEKGPYAK